MVERFWHFQCPVCLMGDVELGCLAADQQLTCEVCREEERGEVRLERWIAEAADLFTADLAA